MEPTIAPTVSDITSDKSMLADPSNDTPWIVLAVSSVVAAEASATAIFAEPSKEVPPIVLAVVNVAAEPEVF